MIRYSSALFTPGAGGEAEFAFELHGEVLGGGYILSPCHVLQNDVPTANIVAMVDAALEGR